MKKEIEIIIDIIKSIYNIFITIGHSLFRIFFFIGILLVVGYYSEFNPFDFKFLFSDITIWFIILFSFDPIIKMFVNFLTNKNNYIKNNTK